MAMKDWKKISTINGKKYIEWKKNNGDILKLHNGIDDVDRYIPELQNRCFVTLNESILLFKTEKIQTKFITEKERSPLTDMDWDMAMNDRTRLEKFIHVKKEVFINETEKRKLWLQALAYAKAYMRKY